MNCNCKVTLTRSPNTPEQSSHKVASINEKHQRQRQHQPKLQYYYKMFMCLSILFGFLIMMVYFVSKGSNEPFEQKKFLTVKNAGVQNNMISKSGQRVLTAKQESRSIVFILQSLKNILAQIQAFFYKQQKQQHKKLIRNYPYQGLGNIGEAIIKKQHEYYLSMPEMQIEAMQLLQQKVHKTYHTIAVADEILYQQQKNITDAKMKNQKKQNKSENSFKSLIEPKCSSKYVINYIWVGSRIPVQYQNLAIKCKDKFRLINETDVNRYMKQWNDMHETKIKIGLLTVMYKVNLGKFLFLYFESGIYADFDTEIDETCFSNIQSDKIMFSNLNFLDSQTKNLVPQQNFMYVQEKYNKQVERHILRMISGKSEWRWDQCRINQCQILMCLNHLRDNTHRKGYGNRNQ